MIPLLEASDFIVLFNSYNSLIALILLQLFYNNITSSKLDGFGLWLYIIEYYRHLGNRNS